MSEETLLEHVQALRDELAKAANIDPRKRDLLGNVLTEVIVHATSSDPAEANKKHSETLRDHAAHFEAEHPRIAGMVGSLADMLSSLGI